MKNNLLRKITSITLKLINDLEKDLEKTPIDLQDKKNLISFVVKLFPVILKLDKMQTLEQKNISDTDLKIINDFLHRKSADRKEDTNQNNQLELI
jgi:hypothetical protein